MMASKLHKVFVYGTLKRGEPNHNWFSKDKTGYSKFICNAQTIEKYPLIIGTKYNIPFLLYSPGHGNYVIGEVYDVDDIVLANLDVLEDHPNYYIRDKYCVKSLDDEQNVEAWIYFIKDFKPELLNQVMFKTYRSKGEHGLEYVSRYERNKDYDHKAEILSRMF